MMFFFLENNNNKIDDLFTLQNRRDITFFEMDSAKKPTSKLLQELCIEIARHTPDAPNEDGNNEGRLNPYVGALLIKKEENAYRIFGASRSALHNGEHGECGLLTGLLRNYIVEGCEMYVSLEPCTHESRHEWTEPCCEIIRNRRIKKVTIGMLDPNPDVAGHGISYLIRNGVEVELFDPQYQKIVREDNRKFSEQFNDDKDPRLDRRIARILDTYVSETAVVHFMKLSHDELGVPYYENRYADIKKTFYRIMIENRSIIDGKSNLLPFDVIDEFALFFYKKPFHKVDGATIRYLFDYGEDSTEHDFEGYDFNAPYAFAFESYNGSINNIGLNYGFVEMIGKRYSGGKTIKELHSSGLQFITDRLGEKGLEIIREAFVNAIIHRDYHNNQSFTRIILKDDCIEIINPVSNSLSTSEELAKRFEAMDYPSHAINPKLMRYFQLISMCERNGSGLLSLKNSNRIKMELSADLVLTTTISFNLLH